MQLTRLLTENSYPAAKKNIIVGLRAVSRIPVPGHTHVEGGRGHAGRHHHRPLVQDVVPPPRLLGPRERDGDLLVCVLPETRGGVLSQASSEFWAVFRYETPPSPRDFLGVSIESYNTSHDEMARESLQISDSELFGGF